MANLYEQYTIEFVFFLSLSLSADILPPQDGAGSTTFAHLHPHPVSSQLSPVHFDHPDPSYSEVGDILRQLTISNENKISCWINQSIILSNVFLIPFSSDELWCTCVQGRSTPTHYSGAQLTPTWGLCNFPQTG